MAVATVGTLGYFVGRYTQPAVAEEQIERKPKRDTQYDYYDNGALQEKREMLNGQRDGLTTSYYPNGLMARQGEYRNDKKHGPWLYLDGTKNADGKQLVTVAISYNMGTPVLKMNIFEGAGDAK